MTFTITWDVVVEHSADPDYWSVYTRRPDGDLIYTHTLSTAEVVHLRDVDKVKVTDRRTSQPWTAK